MAASTDSFPFSDNLTLALQTDGEDGNATPGGQIPADLLSKQVSHMYGVIMIRATILQDRLAMDKWRYIKDYLVVNPNDGNKIDQLLKAGEAVEAILMTLTLWTATGPSSATWGSLINLMQSQGLARTADALTKLGLQDGADSH